MTPLSTRSQGIDIPKKKCVIKLVFRVCVFYHSEITQAISQLKKKEQKRP